MPKTIDNDQYGTDVAIGVDTALNTIADAVGRIKDTATSHHRAFLIEVMGRECGYLALASGIICGAEMALIPEQPATLEQVAQTIVESYRIGKAHCIIMVAEGWKPGRRALVDASTTKGSTTNSMCAKWCSGIFSAAARRARLTGCLQRAWACARSSRCSMEAA